MNVQKWKGSYPMISPTLGSLQMEVGEPSVRDAVSMDFQI
jgi:hypothetical protein